MQHAAVPMVLPPQERTLPRMLLRCAQRWGDRPLVRIAGPGAGDAGGDAGPAASWTVSEAVEEARRTGGTLRAAGIGAGDRVALICGNRPEFLRLLLGCGWIGAVAVPINTASRGAQLAHILANSGARLLVVEAALAGALETLEARPPALEAIWTIGGDAAFPGHLPEPRPLPPPGEPAEPAALRPGDTLAVLYTSGTTGLSKGVRCPHAQYYWWGMNTARLLGLGEGEVLLTTLPLFHTNALNTFFQALLTGSVLVTEPRFSASRFAASLVRHGATVTYLLGAMVPILLSRPPAEEDGAHRVRIALAPGVPAQFHAPFTERFRIALLDGYGSTETNFTIGSQIGAQRPGWMGQVYDGFEAQVVDEDDATLPDGTPGELVLRARESFAFATGYLGMDDKTVEAWRNLWFHTGDRVVRDADGYYRFIDRMKDAIRRRGENISAFEVEQVLLAHPAIANAAVFAVRSELAEDEVMAALVLRDGGRVSPEELVEYCTPRMPYFAVPRYLEVLDALPLTENGKVQKFRLRERGVTPGTWDRGPTGRRGV